MSKHAASEPRCDGEAIGGIQQIVRKTANVAWSSDLTVAGWLQKVINPVEMDICITIEWVSKHESSFGWARGEFQRRLEEELEVGHPAQAKGWRVQFLRTSFLAGA